MNLRSDDKASRVCGINRHEAVEKVTASVEDDARALLHASEKGCTGCCCQYLTALSPSFRDGGESRGEEADHSGIISN